MRLATFLETKRVLILDHTVSFARTIPALSQTSEQVLRNHLPQMLQGISADLRSIQSRTETTPKSHGHAAGAGFRTSAQTHGIMRAQAGISIEQLIAEFRALRSSVLRLWADAHAPGPSTIDDIIRFNEAIDHAVAESVRFYVDERERWRELFLGVLGHDLRSPLNAISLTVAIARKQGTITPAQTALLARDANRMSSLLDSLLEYNRISLGAGMSLQRTYVDLAAACVDELELQRAGHPKARIEYEVQGPTSGMFDALRVREALANLVSNAVNYGDTAEPTVIKIYGDIAGVRITVENAGEIPNHEIERLFEPVRQLSASAERSNGTHLGLGLFIVRQIARAHGGEVAGICAERRVRFTLELPRGF